LALSRTINTNPDLTRFLNGIVGRAYGILYQSPRKSLRATVTQVLTLVAQTGRRRKWFILGSGFGFFIFAFLAYFLMSTVPATRAVFNPPGAGQANVNAWKNGLPNRSATESASMVGFYASNNPMAAISTVALSSVTFGAGGIFELYGNGIGLGTLAYEMQTVGKLGTLIVWLLPHGVTEMSGLFVASGAGFCLAWALINPGRQKRGDALAIAGKDAVVLLCTSVVMMFIAAPFEGYFSFNSNIPNAVKLLVAGVVAMAWATFWTGYGRPDPEVERSS
jgi:uncharacterized membrane protein SpoIIM required for sporulation